MWSYSLDRLAEEHQLTAPGHDPLAGARACAELALTLCTVRGLDAPARVAAELGVPATDLSP